MIKIISNNKIYPNLDYKSLDRFADIECRELTDDWSPEMERELYKCINEHNIINKGTINNLIGGNKVYIEIDYENPNIDSERFIDLVHTNISTGSGIIENSMHYLINALDDVLSISSYITGSEQQERELDAIKALKDKYYYIDEISKMRKIPKLSRLLRIIYDGVKNTFKLDYENESLMAKLSDILARTSQKYILELSTDARDILTASVSDNFTSCYDISRNACNCASVNYLAVDSNTAILKIYKYDEKNVEAMKTGVIPFRKCVARRFIHFTTHDGKIEQLTLGKAYPNNTVLKSEDVFKVLDYLFGLKSGEYYADVKAIYGKNFSGYKDLISNSNVTATYIKTLKPICVGDKGCVCYNEDTGRIELNEDKKLVSESIITALIEEEELL